MNNYSHPSRALKFGLLLGLCWWGWSVVTTGLAVHAAQQRQLNKAALYAQLARPFVTLLDWVTLQQIASLSLWRYGLVSLSQAQPVAEGLVLYTQTLTNPEENKTAAAQLRTAVPQLCSSTEKFAAAWQRSWWWRARAVRGVTATKLGELSSDCQQLAQVWLHGERRLVILLQNSHELRATGGFPGSYVWVALTDGHMTDISVHDIYEPDGQFTGLVQAPAGVREYLSAGRGMRLPDANWSPDFPTSAQTMLGFFAQGKEHGIDGVIAINLELGSELIKLTGPLYLPDYQLTVTPDNIATVARADRETFFPGSYQKPLFLQRLLTQLKIKLSEFSPAQQPALLRLLMASRNNKNIQVYFPHPQLQSIAARHGLAGQLHSPLPPDHPLRFAIIESNVGINKANRHIQRWVELQALQPNQLKLTVSFQNLNPLTASLLSAETATTSSRAESANMHYISYVRVFTHPDVQVNEIKVGHQTVNTWHEDLITTTQQQTYKQIGFLITVPEQGHQTTELTMTLPQPWASLTPQVWIFKQAGLPPTPYTVNVPWLWTEFDLQTDFQHTGSK